MHARKFNCRVIETRLLTPTVLQVRFEPLHKFDFHPGQFLSVYVPPVTRLGKGKKRCYSFANSPERAKAGGYEICLKLLSDGAGSEYFRHLQPGDFFSAMAPYGDFHFRMPEPGQNLCFISTGSGIAPFRSIITSSMFKNCEKGQVTSIFGARTEDEILYRRELEPLGIKEVHCLSRPTIDWEGFHGRVTDYLKTLPPNWAWHTTDFYICGSGAMLAAVGKILKDGHGVSSQNIHAEAFNMAPQNQDSPKKQSFTR